MVRTIKAFDIKGKNILLRVDFNVPMDERGVSNNFRIKTALPDDKNDSKQRLVPLHSRVPNLANG